ncbi:MAG: hypothetical protein K9N46_14025 [Candidatus Marinimicrobia bacterium]|nr:hypothetical protein [Candidatus Neomarinimicrobiota bacterium]MCF7830000.1 hypothetical protein [Candidatus Neomarinimicrobiota bacterium]MCF7881846.1 hypothetical protein [Candidatus Neomarinimicrobiota bacterium]
MKHIARALSGLFIALLLVGGTLMTTPQPTDGAIRAYVGSSDSHGNCVDNQRWACVAIFF